MSLNWLFVDLNSYFASVEQELHPELRGKPIAVIPTESENTSCIAASYEAKAFGVKTGTRVKDARVMCPGIQFVSGSHNIYVEYHERIVEAVEACLPVTSIMSIDEMACELRGQDQKEENAVALAREVKQKILKVGSQLTSSIGIAPNRFLAKVASDMQKPDGLTVIHKEDLPQVLYKLKLRDLPGIGYSMEKRLYKNKIFSMEQLCSLDVRQMKKIWTGIVGERFYQWLQGENLQVDHQTDKTIGHSHVLPPELRNLEKAYAVIQKLLHKAAVRLRKKDFWAGAMSVYVSYLDRESWGEDHRILECQDTLTLNEVLQKIWNPPEGNPLKVAVTLHRLIPDSERNLSFFENEKRVKLSRTVDMINNKYHKNMVYYGGIHAVQMSAPTRIAFSNIPDFSIPGE